MDKLKLVRKIETYSLYIGFVSIFVGIWIPFFNYVSTGAFALTYITALIKQYQVKGKIELISFCLCTSSLGWVIARQFVHSPYVNLAGQVIVYMYLMNTQRVMLGKIQRSFLLFIVGAFSTGFLSVVYPSKLTGILNIAMQMWILYRFMDPILEKIALNHRAKRLAAETAMREEEKKTNVDKNWDLQTQS